MRRPSTMAEPVPLYLLGAKTAPYSAGEVACPSCGAWLAVTDITSPVLERGGGGLECVCCDYIIPCAVCGVITAERDLPSGQTAQWRPIGSWQAQK
jgi:hypothetical protein